MNNKIMRDNWIQWDVRPTYNWIVETCNASGRVSIHVPHLDGMSMFILSLAWFGVFLGGSTLCNFFSMERDTPGTFFLLILIRHISISVQIMQFHSKKILFRSCFFKGFFKWWFHDLLYCMFFLFFLFFLILSDVLLFFCFFWYCFIFLCFFL